MQKESFVSSGFQPFLVREGVWRKFGARQMSNQFQGSDKVNQGRIKGNLRDLPGNQTQLIDSIS